MNVLMVATRSFVLGVQIKVRCLEGSGTTYFILSLPKVVMLIRQTDYFNFLVICRDLNVPTNGMVSYSDPNIPRAVGSTGSYSCDTGYEFNGTRTRTCGESKWSNLVNGTPICTST